MALAVPKLGEKHLERLSSVDWEKPWRRRSGFE
jgi:hypothetical protein